MLVTKWDNSYKHTPVLYILQDIPACRMSKVPYDTSNKSAQTLYEMFLDGVDKFGGYYFDFLGYVQQWLVFAVFADLWIFVKY